MKISTTLAACAAIFGATCDSLVLRDVSTASRNMTAPDAANSGEGYGNTNKDWGYTLRAWDYPGCTGKGGAVKHLVPGKEQKIGVFSGVRTPPARSSIYLTGPAMVRACKGKVHTKHWKHCVSLGQLQEGCHNIDQYALNFEHGLNVDWCMARTLFVTGVDDGGESTLNDNDQTYPLTTSTPSQPIGTMVPVIDGGNLTREQFYYNRADHCRK